MHPETYEQESISDEIIGDNKAWLKEQCPYQVLYWNEQPVGITPETSMVFEVIECEPNVKGDTATGVMKNATIETGANIRVPGFIKKGELIKVDAHASYISRHND